MIPLRLLVIVQYKYWLLVKMLIIIIIIKTNILNFNYFSLQYLYSVIRSHSKNVTMKKKKNRFPIVSLSLCRCPIYTELPSFCTLVPDPSSSCCKKPTCTIAGKNMTSYVPFGEIATFGTSSKPTTKPGPDGKRMFLDNCTNVMRFISLRFLVIISHFSI